jgi:hypothetical protein
MSAAHTPGPWHAEPTVHSNRVNIFGLNPTASFHVGTLVSGSRSKLDVLEANASLIAAAPDLLEALKALLEARGLNPNIVVGKHPIDGHPLNAEGVAAVKAEAAIARATGAA